MLSIGVDMKYRMLRKCIRDLARKQGLPVIWSEGSSHAKVSVGGRATTIPRHSEVNEITARAILTYLFGGNDGN